MAGFPLTAWALRHPWGADVDTVLDRLRASSEAVADERTPRTTIEIATELLDELAAGCTAARSRWGASRIAVVLGSASSAHSLEQNAEVLGLVRARTRFSGPAYHVTDAGGAKAVASADRLLRGSLADAVVVGAVDEDRGALLMLERHGDAFVELRASAEAAGTTDDAELDQAATEHVVSSAWSAAGRPPLGYVHTHAPALGRHAEAEQRVLAAILGPVRCCSTRTAPHPALASDGAIDTVLATASLVRGFTPRPPSHELDHDRVLVHAFGVAGNHVALLLEARP